MPSSQSLARSINSQLFKLAWPLLVAGLSTPLLGLVDTAVMGHLSSPHYLAGVAIGGVVFSFLFRSFRFLRMGTTGVTAQALGRNSHKSIRQHLLQALILALLISGLMLIFKAPLRDLIFWVIESEPIVEFYAQEYYDIRLISAPATLINYVILGWFIGLQNSRIPMTLMILTNVTNIILDLILVMYCHWDIRGVAIATVVAEYLTVALGAWYVWKELKRFTVRRPWIALLNLREMGAMLEINSDLFIRSICLLLVFSLVTQRGAELGEIFLAANTLLLNFQGISAYVIDGLAHAAEALSGRAAGSNHHQTLQQLHKWVVIWGLVIALLFTASYALFGRQIIELLTTLPSVRLTAEQYLYWVIIAPLISVWGVLYEGLFMGTLRSREMRNAMLLSLVVVYVPALLLFAPWGNNGLWIALLLFMTFRGWLLARWHNKHRHQPGHDQLTD